MEEKKATVYDFTKVKIEEAFDVFKDVNVSKALGNAIHQGTGDLGLDEIARTIYKEGKVAIPDVYIPVIVSILQDPGSNMIIAAKVAVIEMLTHKKK